MVTKAQQYMIGLVRSSGHSGREDFPVIDGRFWGGGDQDALLDGLAETFGVSPSFIWVRLNKYRLITAPSAGRL